MINCILTAKPDDLLGTEGLKAFNDLCFKTFDSIDEIKDIVQDVINTENLVLYPADVFLHKCVVREIKYDKVVIVEVTIRDHKSVLT